nr:mucin-5AC [Bactrocera oleae]XP_036225219.1 mucin-5AC [Bactrocera oleae]XP_036225220.1 mucin-5AC [Bactrocera oleae]XP_036225221.1 mucin-5AC [Bactrocera oleae]XP_036225222.1 mucin-5AC [Bactrocera oleae]XP_036225223.1 mucin-5AC [Bactrocera oleae]
MENPSSTFEYLCRVCAANTKGKNSVAECVYILKTPALKDKIERFLYLTISEEDILPKVLCKACFRQVEATASLSKIAKHTQKVFRDFIFNTKSCLQAESSESSNPTTKTPPTKSPKECASVTQVPEKPKPKEPEKPFVQSAESTPPASLPASSTCAHKDEVVLNVSVNDPLTRETQHKMITASRRQNSLDTRFTPKSIAQRGFASTPKHTEVAASTKKPTTSGVINFFPNRQQQVTTVTSGGYVIGCVPETVPTNKTTADQPKQNANTLQQKRKNLKNALNNIKAVNAGQVSLLKVSQKLGQNAQGNQPQSKAVEPPTLLVEDDVPAEPLPEKMIIAATKQQKHQVQVSPQSTPHNEPTTEQQMQSEPTDLSQSARPSIPDDILLGKVIKDGDLLKLILKALKWPVNKHTMEAQLERLRNSRFATIMADPNLLQDADLTQIMGPYLGPVLQAAQMLQQQQQQVAAAAAAAAAVTKETELQVAGITTALPYKLPAETSVQLVPASPEEDAEVTDVTPKTSASNQSLKRDAENDNIKLAPPKKVRKVSARGRSASIFNNDEYAALNSTLTSQYLNSKSTPDIHVDLDPAALFTHLSMLSGLSATSSNDALLALLQRQRAALSRMQQPQSQPQPRRQRSNSIITVPASGSDFVFDTDDIILMEPDDCTESTTTNSQNNGDANAGSSSSLSQNESVTFPVPQQVSKPMITRPIIKRRKTVIQASPARLNLAINTKEVTPITSTPAESVACTATTTKLVAASPNILQSTAAPPRKPSKTQSLDSLNTIATQYPSNIISIGTQVPSNTTNVSEAAPTAIVTKATETMLTVTAAAATSVSSLVGNNTTTNTVTTNASAAGRTTTRNSNAVKRQSSSKSALGQQLLEAIGLQKVAAENKDVAVVSATTPAPRGSIQQIRSALKKSLQKAQEQQQQRSKKAPSSVIIDDNSEETVNVVKEVVVQPRAKSASNTAAGPLDVEEEINKITLVLQSKAKEDKKIEEADKRLTAAAPSRIPGIRRKLLPPTRNRKSTVTLVADEIVDLIDDEENQDAAEGKSVAKKDLHCSNAEQEETDVYLTATSLASLQGVHKADIKDAKSTSPTRRRGRRLKDEIELEDDEDDDDDDKPLKPKTEKNAGDRHEGETRNSTPAPRQRSRPPPANGRKAPSERDFEKESDDTVSVKNDNESTTSTIVSTRPSRISKTMSKYYKGPDKSPGTTRRSAVSTRSSRARN